MIVDRDGDASPPYHTPVETLSARPAVAGVSSVEGFLASEHRVIDPGICVQCIKHLETVRDHMCVQPNSQHNCKYCACLKKPCKTIPFCYCAPTKALVENLCDNTFLEQVGHFAAELEAYLQCCTPKNDNIHALWSLNHNLFHLMNTLHEGHSWELPVDREEVEEEFFRRSMEGM